MLKEKLDEANKKLEEAQVRYDYFFFGYFHKLCGCLQGPPDVVDLMAKAHV